MATIDDDLDGFELYAYVGEDELGSGEMGLKQALVRAGLIPIVAIRRDKVDREDILVQLRWQVARYGKTIRLVRLTYAETVHTITPAASPAAPEPQAASEG